LALDQEKPVSQNPEGSLAGIGRRFENILLKNLDLLLQRYFARADYPFIDMKLSLIDGVDFDALPDAKKTLKGSGAIYSWIQGRGLEALSGHAEWLEECRILSESDKRFRLSQIKTVLLEVSAEVERLRRINGGHLFFCTDSQGVPLGPNSLWKDFAKRAENTSTMSDLFCCKGLFAAYTYLQDSAGASRAAGWFKAILADIDLGRFINDQFFWGKENASPTGQSHASRMIALGGLSLFAKLSGDRFYLDTAAGFIQHIIEKHVNTGRFSALQEFDFIEFLAGDGTPQRNQGRVLSDPGHCLEFVGLATKALRLIESGAYAEHDNLLKLCRKQLPGILVHNFNNGFNRRSGGICKTFDLISRQPVDSNMPWWSLPETIRAASEVLAFVPEDPRKGQILQILKDCADAYLNRYINPSVGCMAYQTRDAQGKVADIPPATPDADPCYHTGLSIIDFLRATARR
jgi:hypothetical protein